MNARDLLDLLRAKPFHPLRVHLADGQVHEVRHAEQALVARSQMIVGIGGDQEQRIYDTLKHIALPDIASVTETD